MAGIRSAAGSEPPLGTACGEGDGSVREGEDLDHAVGRRRRGGGFDHVFAGISRQEIGQGRPTDQAILTARLIDRPLRPSFPEGFRNEVHVVATILGADQENPHDVLAINAASAALMLSGIPFEGPLGAVRLAFSVAGEWIPHPTYQEGDDSTFELVVAGRQLDNGDVAIIDFEGEPL